jgi:cbb3-type cytochrome oxidase maturation protein
MSAIIFLIFIGILVAGGFLAAFIWAVRSGQYDDDYSPSVRMLFDYKTKESDETAEEVPEDKKEQQ